MNENINLYLLSPLFIQAVLMFFDEFYYHHQRGLGTWERYGHPFDTLSVLFTYGFAYSFTPSPLHSWIYIALASFSTVFIAKDELIHKNVCSSGEMVLHAMLFSVHPLVFTSIFIFWQQGYLNLLHWNIRFEHFILGQIIITGLFMGYQILYWGIFYGSRNQQRDLQSTTR